jgi:hypothetical protein
MSGPGAWDGKGGTRAGVPKGGGKTGPRGDDPGQIRAIGGTRGPTGGRRRARRAETHRCLARERPSASRVARGPAETLARVTSRAEPEPRAGAHADATLSRWAARSAPTPAPRRVDPASRDAARDGRRPRGSLRCLGASPRETRAEPCAGAGTADRSPRERTNQRADEPRGLDDVRAIRPARRTAVCRTVREHLTLFPRARDEPNRLAREGKRG